jgi:hypothetical protein
MNIGVPQSAQNPRLTIDEERNMLGVPRVQAKCSYGTETRAAPQDPKDFWHMRQWQIEASPSAPSIR